MPRQQGNLLDNCKYCRHIRTVSARHGVELADGRVCFLGRMLKKACEDGTFAPASDLTENATTLLKMYGVV